MSPFGHRIRSRGKGAFAHKFLPALSVMIALLGAAELPLAQEQPVSIIIVRHAEADTSQPTVPLTAKGRERAALLTRTLQDVKFTHIFGTHTTRTRQTVEGVGAAQNLPIVQLPAPGSMLDGKPVTDQTSRRAPIEPVAAALTQLPPGSVALAALNSENIFAILNKLGVPAAQSDQSCVPGNMCVPCTDNTCFPRNEFDRIWHLVRQPGRSEPLAFFQFRYGAGWQSADR
jgi:Histidine phosphatase superfamily (branch 1)